MPALTPIQRAEKAREGLKRAREQDKLDVAELGNLISATAEICGLTLRMAQRVLNSNKTNDALRIRTAHLINDSAKTLNRCVQNALELGVKIAPEAPVEPAAPQTPDLSE